MKHNRHRRLQIPETSTPTLDTSVGVGTCLILVYSSYHLSKKNLRSSRPILEIETVAGQSLDFWCGNKGMRAQNSTSEVELMILL